MLNVFADFIDNLFQPINEAIANIFNLIVAFCLQNPFTGGFFGGAFNWVDGTTLYIQAIALGIFIIMKVVVGIKDGIFLDGGDTTTGETASQWFFRSLKGLVIICAMPSLMRWVAGFTMTLSADIASSGTTSIFSTFIQGYLVNTALAFSHGTAFAAAKLWSVVVCIILIYYIVVIFFQLIKRQIQLIALSLIAPFVAMTAGTRDSSDLGTLLKEVVSIGIISGLQILFLFTAMTFSPTNFISLDLQTTFSVDNLMLFTIAPFIQIAVFAAIKKFPDWVERYTNVVSVNGNSGRVVAGGAMYAARSLLVRVGR